jgi:predicted O-methyltransferase YrrM
MPREHVLERLIKENGFIHVAELGLWKGRTILHILENCPDVRYIGVDEWRKRPERATVPGGQTYEQWDMFGLETHVRKVVAPYQDRCTILKMSTAEAADLVVDSSLDLVFIDADHSESAVKADIENWLPKVRPGGILAGHDYDWSTVRKVVDKKFKNIATGPDNLWWVRKCL